MARPHIYSHTLHTQMHTQTRTHHARTHARTHTHTRTHINTRTNVYIHTHMHTAAEATETEGDSADTEATQDDDEGLVVGLKPSSKLAWIRANMTAAEA